MTLQRLWYYVRRIWQLLALLAAVGFNIGPLAKLPSIQSPPASPPTATIAPAPPVLLHVNIGSCHTAPNYRADGSKSGYRAVCEVQGTTFVIPPGEFPNQKAAQQAIADFRANNPPAS